MSTEKKEILAAIERMMVEYPDWRIGQIIGNVAHMARGPEDPRAIWEVEDADFVKAVSDHFERKKSLQ